jgi:DNA-binding transcriptional MerR regulator
MIDLHEPRYLSTKAGRLVGTPQRTLQCWTEKNLLSARKGTGGTGDRRLYSLLNLIEASIIKALSSERLSVRKIFEIMSWLRKEGYLEKLLDADNAFLIINLVDVEVGASEHFVWFEYKDSEEADLKSRKRLLENWWDLTNPEYSTKVLVLNVLQIAREVLGKAR